MKAIDAVHAVTEQGRRERNADPEGQREDVQHGATGKKQQQVLQASGSHRASAVVAGHEVLRGRCLYSLDPSREGRPLTHVADFLLS